MLYIAVVTVVYVVVVTAPKAIAVLFQHYCKFSLS